MKIEQFLIPIAIVAAAFLVRPVNLGRDDGPECR
jgi:hypothetical protein